MSNFSWKAKQWGRKILPLALIGGVVYGGYSLYKQGTFRRGLKPAIVTVLSKLPYFGSRFKHYMVASSGNQRYSSRDIRKSYRHNGRHHKGRHSRRR